MKPWKLLTLMGIVATHLLLLFNTRFTVWPEMILYPWLLNNGFALYRDIINPYFPLLPVVLSFFFHFFGASVISLKIFTFLIIVFSDLVVFWSASRLTKSKAHGLLAVTIYVLLQLSYGGNGLWFELMLTPILLTGLVLVYLDSQSKRSLLLAGILLGISVLIKQNSALFYLPAVLLLLRRNQLKYVTYLVLPGFTLVGLAFIYLGVSGLIFDFWQWAIKLALSYFSQPGFVLLPALRQYPYILFPVVTIIGAIILHRKMKDKLFWLICLLLALLFAFPRYENFHLQTLVAITAVLAALLPKRYIILFIVIALVIFSRWIVRDFHQPERFLDNETISLAAQISQYPSIYLLNSPELAYFLADKLPPKPWATNFPWYFEQPGFQDKFIEGLKGFDVRFIVIGEPIGGGKYALGNYLPEKLMLYIINNYSPLNKVNNYQIWQKN